MAADVFQEIKEEDFPKVLSVLEQDWPKHFFLHQTIKVLGEFKKAGSRWKQHLYIHGDWETGVYLNVLFVESWHVRMNVDTASSDLTSMKKALMDTQVIPWQAKDLLFDITDSRFRCVIKYVFTSKNIKCGEDYATMLMYPHKKELHIQPLPEDVYVESLDESFAAEMDRNWPFRHQGSEQMHMECLRYSFGLGVFRRSDKKLLSSAMSNHTGGVFVLFTDEQCRGKGYAAIVVQHMVQECRRLGRIPFATVNVGNKPSERLFTKLGFEPFAAVDYIFPTNSCFKAIRY